MDNVTIKPVVVPMLAVLWLLAGCSARQPVDSGIPLASSDEPVEEIPGYLTSPKGGPLRDALGRCWRTADWRPALAIEACDAELARERKLRELALKLSGVASVPGAEGAWEPEALAALTAPVQARFEGAPPVADATAEAKGEPATEATSAATATPDTPQDTNASPGAPAAIAAGTTPSTGAPSTTAVVGVAAAAAAASAAGTPAAWDSPSGGPAGAPAPASTAAGTRPDPGYIVKPVVLNTDAAFFFGKDRLTAAGKDAVENLAAYFRMWGIEDVQVEVTGHTDRIGNAKDNLELSKRRAEAVKQVLVEAGIPARSISAVGVGASRPVTSPDTCPDDIDRCERINCLAPDRRVEVGLKGVRKAPANL